MSFCVLNATIWSLAGSGQNDADENCVLQSGVPNSAVSPVPTPKNVAWSLLVTSKVISAVKLTVA